MCNQIVHINQFKQSGLWQIEYGQGESVNGYELVVFGDLVEQIVESECLFLLAPLF